MKNLKILLKVTQENISDFKRFLKNHDGTDGIIIVNPDNPTGQFIEKKEMIEFIEDNKEIPIIVDESFIDFVDIDYKYINRSRSNEEIQKFICSKKYW